MASPRQVQLYASVAASADAAAVMTVPQNARLKRVVISVTPTSAIGGADEYIQGEISFNSARQVTTNDATNILGIFAVRAGLTTSGAFCVQTHSSQDVDVPVKAGDKIYLHATESGTTTWAIRCLLFFA